MYKNTRTPLIKDGFGIDVVATAGFSRVSRVKIRMCELGHGTVTPQEHRQIREALQTEAKRLRNIGSEIDPGLETASAGAEAAG
jgi:hypothetical protein